MSLFIGPTQFTSLFSINKLCMKVDLVSFECCGCGGLGIFRFNGVSHEGLLLLKPIWSSSKVSLANQVNRGCIELTSVCIESTLDVYRNDFTCVSKRLWFVSKRLVSKRLCIETTVSDVIFHYMAGFLKSVAKTPSTPIRIFFNPQLFLSGFKNSPFHTLAY